MLSTGIKDKEIVKSAKQPWKFILTARP